MWRKRRENAAPAFASGSFDDMVPRMAEAAEAMFARWDELTAQGQPLDATLEMTRFALDSFLRSLFHSSKDDVAVDMRSSLGVILRDVENRFWSVFSVPILIAYNLPKYRRAQKFLKRLVTGLIQGRRDDHAYPEDLLSLLVDDFGLTPYEKRLSFIMRCFPSCLPGMTPRRMAWPGRFIPFAVIQMC
jgi:cytochrome P450